MLEEFFYRAQPWAATLVLHNWPIMLYGGLSLWVAIHAFLRPTRWALLALYGLLVLSVAFEYQKHGTRILRGTTSYLLDIEGNARMLWISQLILLDVLPVTFHLLGLALLIAAIGLYATRLRAARTRSVDHCRSERRSHHPRD